MARYVIRMPFLQAKPIIKRLQIVPKQSAILTAYPNNGIHATHKGMTRFKTAEDTGYVRVHNQLWLWYNTIEENQETWKEKQGAVNRQQQHLQPANVTESDNGGILYSGSVFIGPITGHQIFWSESIKYIRNDAW